MDLIVLGTATCGSGSAWDDNGDTEGGGGNIRVGHGNDDGSGEVEVV